MSYLLNLAASILAVLNSEPVHLAVSPRVPSAARLLTPPSTSFCQGSQTGGLSETFAGVSQSAEAEQRWRRKLQKAEQLPELVPVGGLLKRSMPFVPTACGAGSRGCRILPVINGDALHRRRLCALGIEPSLSWSSGSFAGWHQHPSRSCYTAPQQVTGCCPLPAHLLQPSLKHVRANKMEAGQGSTDLRRGQRLLFPVLLRSDIFQDRMSPVRTPVPRTCVNIPSKSHVTMLYTKCSFINLHASIHIDIHVYVWTLHFTAPSIWKIQRKGKTLTVYLNNSQRGKKEKKKPNEAITEKKDSCSQVLEKYQR